MDSTVVVDLRQQLFVQLVATLSTQVGLFTRHILNAYVTATANMNQILQLEQNETNKNYFAGIIQKNCNKIEVTRHLAKCRRGTSLDLKLMLRNIWQLSQIISSNILSVIGK